MGLVKSQEQTQRYIAHTTTNTQSAFGSVLIKGRTKFKRSKNVPCLDRLFPIEFAFNYWNISAYLLKKWIYYCEITMLRNNQRIVYIFESAMLAHHRPPPWRVPILKIWRENKKKLLVPKKCNPLDRYYL